MRWLRFAVEGALFTIADAGARLVPRGLLPRVGALAGLAGYLLDAEHRRVGRDNLRLAYGAGFPDRELHRIHRACWRHFAQVTLDSLALRWLTRDEVGRRIRYEGLEHIRAAYARGHGVLLFSAHFGHWELVALAQGHLSMPLALVARPLDNPWLERRLRRLRRLSGNTVLDKRHALTSMLRVLRQGGGVAIVIDQDARREGVFVPFFGHPASTTPTLALLALRTGAAVVPVFSVPEPDGSYRVIYEAEVPVDRSDDRDRDVVRLTARCTAIIERWVRQYPELWLWMHRRWKTRPDDSDTASP
jgi:KDO2-lipid IV(A) lauroyltransferase